MQIHEVEKLDFEAPVPTCWRDKFAEIVECIASGDYLISRGINGLRAVDTDTSEQIQDYIESYGEQVISLPEQSWDTSIYSWQESYWDVLVDLWTVREGRSDLVLQLRVFEVAAGYEFQIYMVYVP